jgi:hypothetical protein
MSDRQTGMGTTFGDSWLELPWGWQDGSSLKVSSWWRRSREVTPSFPVDALAMGVLEAQLGALLIAVVGPSAQDPLLFYD